MKKSDWIIQLSSLAIIAGVYFGITLATILAWIITLVAIMAVGFGVYFVSQCPDDAISKAKSQFTLFKSIYGVFSQVLFIYVFYVTANLSLLFAYWILLILTYTFIYKLFTRGTN